ncbi:MAG: 2-dehydro-3-deoxygalactonokinase [Pseudomonadota bacterium]
MTHSHAPLIGIDWGTSNRRAYLLDQDGKLIKQHIDDKGILKVAGDFKSAVAELLQMWSLDTANVIMAGMVGSRNGWCEVPYLDSTYPLRQLPQAMLELDNALTGLPGVRCRIVPGYRHDDPDGQPDVMRGEETQAFGVLMLGAPDGWMVLPGTHSKWLRVAEGKVVELMTFMTGELYALLSQHGTLASLMGARVEDDAAFQRGMRAAQSGTLTHTLFTCRALVVTNTMPASEAASYLSGLLIGSELHDIRRRTSQLSTQQVHIIGASHLAGRYAEALGFFDISSRAWQPDEVFLAALRALAA